MEPQPLFLATPNDRSLIGTWRSELAGTDPADLTPIEPQFLEEMTLRSDGTALLRRISPQSEALQYKTPPPFPMTWENNEKGMLVIYVPVQPMPEYGIFDWIQGARRRDVLSVSQDTLMLSDRSYDGELITTYRRQAKMVV